jgi:hypothetical protein
VEKLTASDIIEALKKRHPPREWAFFPELRVGTGYQTKRLAKLGINPEQRLDAFALNLYPSKEHMRIVYEIKVSRSDFQHEIKNPMKRKQGLELSNEFYFVTPVGLVRPEEIPEECGLIEVHDNLTSRIKVRAPKRTEALEPSWGFIASIARRVQREEQG